MASWRARHLDKVSRLMRSHWHTSGASKNGSAGFEPETSWDRGLNSNSCAARRRVVRQRGRAGSQHRRRDLAPQGVEPARELKGGRSLPEQIIASIGAVVL